MMKVRPVDRIDRDIWLRMRAALWPEESEVELADEVDRFLDDAAARIPFLSAVFVSEDGTGQAAGFIELFVRNYAEGCDGAAPHVEAWYVCPEFRGNGLGRALMHAAERWARANGFSELASDTTLSNEASQNAHQRLGFEEVERSVHLSLAGVHSAVDALLAEADRAGTAWTVPRAAGKWSPAQVVEHVARIMEESANVASGAPSKFPKIPFFMRPIVRLLVFKRILRRKSFLKMKAGEGFDPPGGSATPAEGRVRLQAALTRFGQACRARADSGQRVSSTIFGKVPVVDFARFQELHVRHHLLQMPGQ